jgi:GWxTD domain-containing protein
MTAGFLRPVILLPESSCEWSADTRLAVLAHEEAHIARGDWAIALVARINRAFFFFHPLAWWLERKLASLAEQACDDAALSQVRDRATYAEALLDMARAVTFAHGKIFTQGIAMARTANVKHRIESVLDESRRIPHALGRRGWATLLTCALPVLYIALAAQLAPAQAPPASATHATPTFKTPFQRWADEEVVYIITPEELAAYNRLAGSTAEQEHFIEQFWERRNPAPGTSENKYRDEHYRRIAYSNERLPGASAPGWQTDRGRIYITFGPPDEIESHPSSDARSVPYEQWLYRHIDAMGDNVIFTFTDYESNGDYRLAAATGPKGLQKSATVHVNPDHEAVMTLPLAEGKGPFSVVIEVSSGKGRTIVSKTEQGGVQLSSLVQRLGHLAPGHYTLKTRVTDIATGQTGVSVVNFTVP